MHPTCALNPKSGWTRRIIKCEETGSQWDMFCPTHAAAVKDPVKPKPKKAPMVEASVEEAVSVNRSRHSRPPRTSEGSVGRMSTFSFPPDHIAQAMAVISAQQAKEMMRSSARPSVTSEEAVFTLSEWPGMAEGEAMDLEHFWNFVSMMFPEDHSARWVENMMNGIFSAIPSDESSFRLYALGAISQRPIEESKELSLTERERIAALDYEKRSELLWNLSKSLKLLSPNIEVPPENGRLFPLIDFQHFLIESRGQAAGCSTISPLKDSLLRVAFESEEERKEACYSISVSSDRVNPHIEDSLVIGASKSLIGGDPVMSHTEEASSFCYLLHLEEINSIALEDRIQMPDKVLISSSMNDFLNWIIKTDQHWYLKSLEVLKGYMRSFVESNLIPKNNGNLECRKEWRKIEEVYRRQRIWKRVGRSVSLGMQEQPSMMKPLTGEATAAASDMITDPSADPNKPADPEAPIDDSICHVCFDGSSTETNTILFCDGCNAAMHQSCYGISEVPEGNYFCDRCRAIQTASEDPDSFFIADEHGRDAVTCCLCPLYHGALKPTTDGRWVHLCCALWSRQVTIENLDEMGPIDLGSVSTAPLHFLSSSRAIENLTNGNEDTQRHLFEQCGICGVRGGFLEACNSNDEICTLRFHPLCAWYEGFYVKTTVTDPTFQGLDRDGLFPSGLQYCFKCFRHTPAEFAAAALRKHHQAHRRKFRLDERDLDFIPGQRKSKKKRRPVAAPRTTNKAVVARDLNPDLYDDFTCAACMNPIPDCIPSFLQDVIAAASTSASLKCMGCGICVHKDCYSKDITSISGSSWRCQACIAGAKDVRCILCPRRGGFFVPAADSEWVHEFCYRYSPVQRRKGPLELRSIPKEFRFVKCVFCNRKTGASLKCNELGCSVYFHALCAERSGKVYIRSSNGCTRSYCGDHIPTGVHKTSEGYWVDVVEIQSLHYSLDRARLIMDTLRRRDRHKKMIYKTDGELVQLQLGKIIDRIMDRRTFDTPEKNHLFNDEEYNEAEGGFEDLFMNKASKNNVSEEIIQQGPNTVINTDIGELKISSTWIDENELKIPRRLRMVVAGKTISRKDTTNISPKDFKLGLLPRLMKSLESSYSSNSIVKRAGDLHHFEKQFMREWTEYKKMSLEQFIMEMSKLDIEVSAPHRVKKKPIPPLKPKVTMETTTHAMETAAVAVKAARKAVEAINKEVAHVPDESFNHKDESMDRALADSQEGKKKRKLPQEKRPKVGLVQHISDRMDTFASNIEHITTIAFPEIEDWKVAEGSGLSALECRIQFILNRVMNYKVPVDNVVKKQGRGISKKRSSLTSERLVAEDFTEIPYDLIPNYDSLVRRSVSLATMLGNLQQHKYHNMASFCADFYEMLSNSRLITEEGSLVSVRTTIFRDLIAL